MPHLTIRSRSQDVPVWTEVRMLEEGKMITNEKALEPGSARPSFITFLFSFHLFLAHVAFFIATVHRWTIQLVNERILVPNAGKLWLHSGCSRSFSAQPTSGHYGPKLACSLQAEPGHCPTRDPQGAGSCEGRALRNVSIPFPKPIRVVEM